MVILAVVVGVVGGALAGVVAAVVLVRHLGKDTTTHDATVAAAVEHLELERDATLDALRAQLDDERRQLAEDRDRALQTTIDTLLSVAGDKLGAHATLASQELNLRGEAIDQRVAGMNDELRMVRELVAQLQKEKAEQHGQIVQGLDQAVRASATLQNTTQSLREALSNSRARGQWGERMADDVLRSAGLVEGLNYRRQMTLPGGTRPDFSFVLPRGRNLHMDVKFPLDNYLRVLEATTDAERAAFTKAFLRDVRARIRELDGRDYTDPEATVGYVLLFIPNESVYGFMHEHDPGVLDDALAHKVVLCSPCTLFAVLGVVRQAVENFLVERKTDEILECLGGFTKQWQSFSEKLDKLGNQFATTQRTYDELAGTRRRQLQKQLDHVDHLRTSRSLDELDRLDADPVPQRSVTAVALDTGAPRRIDDGSDAPPAPREVPRQVSRMDDRRPEPDDDDLDDDDDELDFGGDRIAVGGGGPNDALDASTRSHPASARRVTRLRPVGGR